MQEPTPTSRCSAEDWAAAVFGQAALGACRVSALGQIEQVNPEFCRVARSSAAALLQRELATLVHADDRARVVQLCQAAAVSGESHSLEHRWAGADGQCVWVNTSGSRLGASVLLLTVDLTKQRNLESLALPAQPELELARDQAEAARAAAEHARERLYDILASIPTAIAVTRGPQHVYELVNPAYAELTGHRPLIGRAVAEVFPGTNPGSLEQMAEVLRSGRPRRMPELHVVYDRNDDGVSYEGYFEAFLAPMRDAQGQPCGVVSSTLEVTEHVHQRRNIEILRQEAEAARAELEQAHAHLEQRIAARTAELARSNAALAAEIRVREAAETTRHELQRRLATAREDERRRAARDLHDQVGQTLTALMLAVKTACDGEPLPPSAAGRLQDALRLADDLGRDVHELATRLRPALLDDLGLYAALRALVQDWSRRYATKVDLQAAWLQRERPPADIETVLYRVVQEALTNVARHARAQHVSVVVERHAGDAIAVVEDDGIGFDVTGLGGVRLGLMGMRERVTLVGGTLDIESALGAGTTVIARVPAGARAADHTLVGEQAQS